MDPGLFQVHEFLKVSATAFLGGHARSKSKRGEVPTQFGWRLHYGVSHCERLEVNTFEHLQFASFSCYSQSLLSGYLG
jgi:hypothetical protein